MFTSIQAFATTPIVMDIHFDAFMKGLEHGIDPPTQQIGLAVANMHSMNIM